MAPQTIPELDLLVTADAQDNTLWPIFNLIDAYALDTDGEFASLLESDGQPRTLIGQLEPLTDDQAHLLKIRSLRRAPRIEIIEVMTASVDLDSDELTLKAAGQAGWYNVQPAEAYRAVWKDMTMAVDLFRWLVKIHHQQLASKKRKPAQAYQNWPVEQLFEAYGLEYFKRPKMAPEAAQKIFKHKEFILRCMLQGKGNIEWTDTPLYFHMAKRFPKQVKAANASFDVRPGSTHSALPIRSSASMLKRKHGQAVNGGQPATIMNDDSSPTERPASFRRTSLQHGSRELTRQPETPKNNPVRDRRGYAMKGQSALRPSAVKPSKNVLSYHKIDASTSDSETEEKARSSPADKLDKCLRC
ncbi:hypothetical protein AMS68_000821 [Peltaster fructicola]|uniref:Uncharacterized protein n=1 Tax=Peltaster fructicola TaxID=286661 RepID=A0A6H0XKP6_9PEZI|nr:hypothetical protein AMS68_000821 [Peltaster fructicola]